MKDSPKVQQALEVLLALGYLDMEQQSAKAKAPKSCLWTHAQFPVP